MANAPITKRKVDAVKPGERDQFLWDEDPKGFGLKVTPAGNRVYILQYRMGGRESRTRRFTIGKHGSPWTPETARAEAKRLLTLVRQGQDPAALERKRRDDAVNLAFESYALHFINRYAKANQPRSWAEAERVLKRDIAPGLKGRPLPEISRGEIARLLENMAERAPALAKYAHALLRKLFRWAVDRGDLALSPMVDMRPPATIAARDRVLTDRELRAVWLACDDMAEPFGPLVRFMIATGQRRGEVAAMAWEELDRDAAVWTVPAERSKNGNAHSLPLNDAALAVLDALGAETRKRGLVFTTTGKTPVSGFSKAKRRLDEKALEKLRAEAAAAGEKVKDVALPGWRYHDIRRTVATGLQRLGTRLEVTESVLNHISGSRAGIVGVYQRHHWADEKRTALDAWARHLGEVVSGQPKGSNVVALDAARA